MVDCLVGLGANLGDRRATLDAAVEYIAEQIAQFDTVDRLAKSRWSAYSAVGGPDDQDEFLNGVVRFQSGMPPAELLGQLRLIESRHGRERRQRWAARTLDADLLLYGDQILETPELQVPHPRMTFRPFVMGPAVEVAPEMRHPRLQATLAQIDERRRSGQDCIVLVGRSKEDRQAVRRELAAMSPTPEIVGDADASGSPKLQICLDAVTPPLPGTPALWLPAGLHDRWPAELAAAVACVWPAP